MNFKIPQFLEVEDKILGPLTLKQSLYLAVALIITLFFWSYFKFWFFLLIGVPLAMFFVAMAFLKLNGRPFDKVIFSMTVFLIKPKTYTFQKKSNLPY